MGFLSSLFGKKEEYPTLEPSSPAADQIERHRAELLSLAERSGDRLEAVPGQKHLYVYVGDPPKKFGLVWYEEGVEHNFADEMNRRGLTATRIQDLSDELRTAYEQAEGAPRYSYPVNGKEVIVAISDELAAALNQAIHEVEEE